MSRMSRTIISIVAVHLLAAVTGQELEKRNPQAFGMWGNKFEDGSEQFYKRKPQFFVGVKGKKDAYKSFESPDMYYKRVPMGFMGMRGKKDLFFDDKRAPMGFVGMRGKKEMYSEEEKRTPMGFVGMRGKKEMYSDEEKRTPMGFVGMRGKKELFSDEEKRTPMGFVGMRGKKPFSDEKDYYPESFEYAPEHGSLIGQIDYSSNERTNEFPLLNEIITEYLKKLEGHSTETTTEASGTAERFTNEVQKRGFARVIQMLEDHGKLNYQDKRPYDVSVKGKFIGVRGKKDLKNSGAQEIKFLLDQREPFPKRKGAMGFIGMRGKKWTDESSPETAP